MVWVPTPGSVPCRGWHYACGSRVPRDASARLFGGWARLATVGRAPDACDSDKGATARKRASFQTRISLSPFACCRYGSSRVRPVQGPKFGNEYTDHAVQPVHVAIGRIA